MPYAIVKEFRFAAAHFIPDHPGKCRNLHGHNYRIRLELGAEALDHLGMVMDFADVKAMLEETAGRFDHRFLNEMPPFDEVNSTAEELSAHLYREISARLDPEGRVHVRRIEVWESESSCAIYEP